MSKVGYGRIKGYKKSGAMLYIPERLFKDPKFPFKDGSILKITIGDSSSMSLTEPKWWELLNWSKMRKGFERLPAITQEEIRKAGLAPTERKRKRNKQP